MERNKLFEGFFFIEPTREKPTDKFQDTRVVYSVPSDINQIAKEFRDVSQFCFPDLEIIKLEHGEKAKVDHYSFTLTDKDGGRMYGICLRGLDQGSGRHFDVQRRPRKCFCFISRNPFFSFFRAVLTQAYGLSLLRPGGERAFIEQVYQHAMPAAGEAVSIQCSESNKMYMPMQFYIPLHKGLFYRETPIVPLVQALGAEQFLLILSAAMCERRLIFIAEDVGTLSRAVNAAAAMLYPFQWPHMFIPLLPSKLLSYAAAPTPYMIGVRRYLLPRLFKEAIDDVVIIDLDSGECTVHGNCQIKNFVGAAGTVRKQATESLTRMTASMSKLLSTSKTSGPATGDDRDLVACLLADLRGGISKMPKPSGQSDMFRMGKSATDGSIDSWAFEFEKVVRDSLLLFHTFLFADMEDAMTIKSSGGKQKAFPDIKLFKIRRQQLGITKELNEFLDEFLRTQLFESFSDERCDRFLLSMTGTASQQRMVNGKPVNSRSDDSNSIDEFDWISQSIRSSHKSATCTTLMERIAALHAEMNKSAAAPADITQGETEDVSGSFHPLTLQLTSNSESTRVDGLTAMDTICQDACNSKYFAAIMRTIWLRLEDCKGGNWKHGVKGLALLQTLILAGPEGVLADAVDHFTLVRQLMRYRANADMRSRATDVLNILLDHGRTESQRRYWSMKRCGAFPYTLCTRRLVAVQQRQIVEAMKTNGGAHYHPQTIGQFPDFSKFHAAMKPSNAASTKGFSPTASFSPTMGDFDSFGSSAVRRQSAEFDILSSDPFGATSPVSNNDPFAASSQSDPFGGSSSDPFVVSHSQHDPFGPSDHDPFSSAGVDSSDPFATTSSDPFSTSVSEASPISPKEVDPFVTSYSDPFSPASSGGASIRQADPFATAAPPLPPDRSAKAVVVPTKAAGSDLFAADSDPFEAASPMNSPNQAEPHDPFASAGSDPFGSSSADPFAPAPAPKPPVSQPKLVETKPPVQTAPAQLVNADPFGSSSADPFAASSADPFGETTAKAPVSQQARQPVDPTPTVKATPAAPASKPSNADPFGSNSANPYAPVSSKGSTAVSAPVSNNDPFAFSSADPFAITPSKAAVSQPKQPTEMKPVVKAAPAPVIKPTNTDPFGSSSTDPFAPAPAPKPPVSQPKPVETKPPVKAAPAPASVTPAKLVNTDPFGSSAVDPFAPAPNGGSSSTGSNKVPFAADSADPFGSVAPTAPANRPKPVMKSKSVSKPVPADPFGSSLVDPFAAAPAAGTSKTNNMSSNSDPFAVSSAARYGSSPAAAPVRQTKQSIDPFASGGSDPFASSSVDPFAPAPAADVEPSKKTQSAAKPDPFSAGNCDPFGSLTADASSSSRGVVDPFQSAPKAAHDPFSASSSDPFAAPVSRTTQAPSAAPRTVDPFASSSHDPFSSSSSDPFGGDMFGDAAAHQAAPATARGHDGFAASSVDPFASASDPFAPAAPARVTDSFGTAAPNKSSSQQQLYSVRQKPSEAPDPFAGL